MRVNLCACLKQENYCVKFILTVSIELTLQVRSMQISRNTSKISFNKKYYLIKHI